MRNEYLESEYIESRADAEHLDFLALFGHMPWLPPDTPSLGAGMPIPTRENPRHAGRPTTVDKPYRTTGQYARTYAERSGR